MKNKIKNELNKVKLSFINIWKNNPVDIIFPIISLILLIVSLFILEIIPSILIPILMNLPYFTIMFVINKQEK